MFHGSFVELGCPLSNCSSSKRRAVPRESSRGERTDFVRSLPQSEKAEDSCERGQLTIKVPTSLRPDEILITNEKTGSGKPSHVGLQSIPQWKDPVLLGPIDNQAKSLNWVGCGREKQVMRMLNSASDEMSLGHNQIARVPNQKERSYLIASKDFSPFWRELEMSHQQLVRA